MKQSRKFAAHTDVTTEKSKVELHRLLDRYECSSQALLQQGGRIVLVFEDGIWILEPIPSSRDDDFFRMYRWASAQAALDFWESHKVKSWFEHYRTRAQTCVHSQPMK